MQLQEVRSPTRHVRAQEGKQVKEPGKGARQGKRAGMVLGGSWQLVYAYEFMLAPIHIPVA